VRVTSSGLGKVSSGDPDPEVDFESGVWTAVVEFGNLRTPPHLKQACNIIHAIRQDFAASDAKSLLRSSVGLSRLEDPSNYLIEKSRQLKPQTLPFRTRRATHRKLFDLLGCSH
jgi:hypothetical protein